MDGGDGMEFMGTAVKLLNLQRNFTKTTGPVRGGGGTRSAAAGEKDFRAELDRHHPGSDTATTSSESQSHAATRKPTEAPAGHHEKSSEETTPSGGAEADNPPDAAANATNEAGADHPSDPSTQAAAQSPAPLPPTDDAADPTPAKISKKDKPVSDSEKTPPAPVNPLAAAAKPAPAPQPSPVSDQPKPAEHQGRSADHAAVKTTPPQAAAAAANAPAAPTATPATPPTAEAATTASSSAASPPTDIPAASQHQAAGNTPPVHAPAEGLKRHHQAHDQHRGNSDQSPDHRNANQLAAAAMQPKEVASDPETSPAADASSPKLKLAVDSDPGHSFQPLLQADAPKPGNTGPTLATGPATAAPAPRPEAHFVETNHPNIITSIRNQLLPGGGTMHLRLDPPELGAMQVTVRMHQGVMTASFETSNDQAARLLSHSLHQLKDVLESQGVQVDKLQVRQQTIRQPQHAGDGSNPQHHGQENPTQQQQQQQRRDLMRRMWAKFAFGDQPLDITG